MRSVLLDADITAYWFALTGQKTYEWEPGVASVWVDDPSSIYPHLKAKIDELQAELDADQVIVCLSAPSSEGWRRDVLPSYKANRGPKPELLGAMKDYMRKTYRTFERPRLEADDILGILATNDVIIPGEKIIVSTDKDLKTIPGLLFNPNKSEKPVRISEAEADYWHLYQTLVGDSTDNYKGCPGIGPKKAEAALFAYAPPWGTVREAWDIVCGLYRSKGLTESDALVQARVARICRTSDYDFKRKEVKLWTPPAI